MSIGKETSVYVLQAQWPGLGELAKGYSEHLMPASLKLDKTNILVTIGKTLKVAHKFQENHVTSHILEGGD